MNTHNKSRKDKKIKYTKDELKSLYWDYIKICNYESYSYGGGVGCGGGYKYRETIEGFIEWLK